MVFSLLCQFQRRQFLIKVEVVGAYVRENSLLTGRMQLCFSIVFCVRFSAAHSLFLDVSRTECSEWQCCKRYLRLFRFIISDKRFLRKFIADVLNCRVCFNSLWQITTHMGNATISTALHKLHCFWVGCMQLVHIAALKFTTMMNLIFPFSFRQSFGKRGRCHHKCIEIGQFCG
jgi:hypothetical protein